MNKDEVLLYTPLLVEMELGKVDDVPAMLSAWKSVFLVGWNLEVWEKLKKREKSSAGSRILGFSRVILKWFWPVLTLSAAAYFGVWSALFLSVVLLPLQIFVITLLFLKLYFALCVKSAFDLENRPDYTKDSFNIRGDL